MYVKFLKELCTNKMKLKDDERVPVGENVSAVLQRKMPPVGISAQKHSGIKIFKTISKTLK